MKDFDLISLPISLLKYLIPDTYGCWKQGLMESIGAWIFGLFSTFLEPLHRFSLRITAYPLQWAKRVDHGGIDKWKRLINRGCQNLYVGCCSTMYFRSLGIENLYPGRKESGTQIQIGSESHNDTWLSIFSSHALFFFASYPTTTTHMVVSSKQHKWTWLYLLPLPPSWLLVADLML